MTTTASYTVNDTGSETHFDVAPARASTAYRVITGIMSAVAFIPVLLTLGLGPVGFVVLGIPLAILIRSFLWRLEWRHYSDAQRYRKPVRVTVGRDTLIAGPQKIALDDITEFVLRRGGRREIILGSMPTTSVVAGTGMIGAIGVGVHAVGAAANQSAGALGIAMRERQAERSYTLGVRLRQGSDIHVIAGGLTGDTGQALMKGIGAAIASRNSH